MVDQGQTVAAVPLLHEVGGEEDGDAAAAQLLERAPQVAPRRRVEPGARLVEQEEARPVEERLGDLGAAAEPPRQLASPLPVAVGEAEAGERRVYPSREIAPAEAIEMPLVPEVLADRELEVEARALEDDAEEPPHRPRLPSWIEAEDTDLAGLRARQGGEETEERRLAAAVGAEEAEDLPRRHVEIDPNERPRGTGGRPAPPAAAGRIRELDAACRDGGGSDGGEVSHAGGV